MGVSRCGNVGIDIERVRPASAEIVTRFFTSTEKAALASLSGADWLLAFYRCWTRKEALLKANGNGLFSGLATHDVLPTHSALGQPLQLGKPQSPDCSSIYEFEPAAGFIGAIALGSHRPAVLRRFASI
jgi:4'-phosphopantetheinyl transferase